MEIKYVSVGYLKPEYDKKYRARISKIEVIANRFYEQDPETRAEHQLYVEFTLAEGKKTTLMKEYVNLVVGNNSLFEQLYVACTGTPPDENGGIIDTEKLESQIVLVTIGKREKRDKTTDTLKEYPCISKVESVEDEGTPEFLKD